MHLKHLLPMVLGLVLCGANVPPSHAETPGAELYTMGPGDKLFSKFGHAALCVTTEIGVPDLCFNYGTTDFSRPVGLTWDVLRGRAEFFVSVSRREDMLSSFRYQDRTIYRQTLPLTNDQVLRLARELNEDALPENQAYIYDHFLENCSTKPRDLIDGVTGGRLSTMRRAENPTYRDLVNEQLGYSWPLVFLSDLYLGRQLDHVTTPYEAMFLPDLLRAAVADRLGSNPVIVYDRESPLPSSNAEAGRRWTWFLMIGFAVITSAAIVRGATRIATATRVFVGVALGLLGALLLFMAIASPEAEIRYNENLLVFLATDFLLVTGRRKLISWNARLRAVGLAFIGVLAAVGVLVQPLWPFWCAAFPPLVAVAGTRTSKTRSLPLT